MDRNALVNRLLKAWNAGNVADIAATYSADAVMLHPMSPQPIQGRAAIEQVESGLFQAFSGFEWQALASVAEGDRAAIEIRVTAVHSKPLPTPAGVIPPTNKRIDVRICSMVRVDAQGLIAEEHRYFDTAAMMAQLGLR
jgi:steroid delta-isomerase-like uncharacterized protein